MKVWDIETGQVRCDVSGHPDIIQSSGWDFTGTLFATAAKDKKVRVIDPRAGQIVADAEAHPGVKGMRCAFFGSEGEALHNGFLQDKRTSIFSMGSTYIEDANTL